MARGKKSLARDKSPAVVGESIKKTPKPRGRSTTKSASKKEKTAQTRSKSRTKKGAETKLRERSRTMSRSRSRSRSRSTSKSPKRKGRPRMRSRSRSRSQKKAEPVMTRARSKSRSKKLDPVILNKLIDISELKKPNLGYKDVLHDEFLAKESKLNEIIRRSISRELSQEKTNTYRVPTHTSMLTNLKEVEPRTKNIDGMSKEVIASSATMTKKKRFFSFSVPQSLVALFGLIAPPLVVLLLHLACNRNQCTVSKFHIPRNWKYYFSLEAMGIVIGFICTQVILSLLPLGKRVDGPPGVNGTLQYRCNGLLTTVLSVGIVAGLWYYKFPVTIVYDKLISILVSSIILAYIIGLFLFVKGGRAPIPGLNPAGIVGSRLHQFFVGREVNPLLFRSINIKTVLIRSCLNGMLILNGLLALKAHEAKHELSHSLLLCVLLNSLLVFDFFWFESSFPLTFEAMYEGTGCLLALRYLLYPFLPALITKYIIQRKIEVPLWGCIAITIAFVVGFIIHRASSVQKAAFRKCPLNPALTQLEAIPTNRGKKLLVAGWWGWVRHPNYLGTIFLHWAWASSCGYSHVIPYTVPIMMTLLLMLRAKRVDSFCSQRYQSSWEEYCSRVRYRIFPRVY